MYIYLIRVTRYALRVTTAQFVTNNNNKHIVLTSSSCKHMNIVQEDTEILQKNIIV